MLLENSSITDTFPYHAQWDITSGCNHQCTFCLTSSGCVSPNELSTDEAITLIDSLYNNGIWFLKIMGGEPFFRKDTIKLFNYAAEKGMILSFSTNASLISKEISQELSKIKNSIIYAQMSLYGENEERYMNVTGSSLNFDKALRGLSLLIDAGIDVSVLTVVTPDNVSSLSSYYNLIMNRGVKEFRLAVEVPLGRGVNVVGGESDLWAKLIDFLNTVKNNRSVTDPYILIDARPAFGEYLQKLTGCNIFYENCTAATSMLYIGPTGSILPCPFLLHLPENLKQTYSHIEAGDIRKNTVMELWNSDSFNKFRTYHEPEKNLFGIKTECKYFKSKDCIPCSVTPCNCTEMINIVNSGLKKQINSKCQ